MVKDLVCGMDISENNSLKEAYRGKIYHFCSEQCRSSFKANPEKFVG